MSTPEPMPSSPGDPVWLTGFDLAIPVFPAVAQRALALTTNPDTTVRALADLVSKDQVLATRVLALANSAWWGALQEVSTVHEAIVRLGMDAVRNVVLTVCYSTTVRDEAVYGNRGPLLIDHALGTAYLARLVAERARVDLEEAFLCGLVHDIGKLVILKLAYDHRRKSGSAVHEAELERTLAERHADLGGRVLRKLNLPESLDEPVSCHHDYRAASLRRNEAAVVYAANLLAHRYGFGCDLTEELDLLEDPVAGFLGLDQDWLTETNERAPGLYLVARQALN